MPGIGRWLFGGRRSWGRPGCDRSQDRVRQERARESCRLARAWRPS